MPIRNITITPEIYFMPLPSQSLPLKPTIFSVLFFQ